MKRIALIVALGGFLLTTGTARASTPHYLNGAEGILLATPPPPGVYYRMTNMIYSANSVRNDKGKKLNVDFNFNSCLNLHSLLYAPDFEILGGRFLADIIVPLVYNKLSLQDELRIKLPNSGSMIDIDRSMKSDLFAVGDIQIDPFYLAWSGDRFDFLVTLGILAPVGNYSSSNPTSTGRGFWTVMPGMGGTLYFDAKKTWSASILARYEVHSKQKETHVTPGNHFHFEWGIGKNFATYWEAGIAGYAAWQMTKDRGARASDLKSRAFAVGPEIFFTVPKWKSTFGIRSVWEFQNRNGAQGNMTTISWDFVF